jgi:hypothetical protein
MLRSNEKQLEDTFFVDVAADAADTHSTRPREFEFEAKKASAIEALRRKHASCSITFYLPNVRDPFIVSGKDEFVLGRHDAHSNYMPDVDLHPFHAQKLGVSRQHACIIYAENCFYIIDLDSTNGTFVNYRKLESSDMFPLKSGDIIQLGHLALRVG